MSYRYIILDRQSTAIARGYLESPPDSPIWYIRVLDGAEERVMEHEYIQLVSMEENAPAKAGRIVKRRDSILVVEPVDSLNQELQRDLRVQIKFDTFLYPVTGKWKGRIHALSYDLSCGGVAIFCKEPLEEHEKFEIVIPITSKPLVLKAQVLRRRPNLSPIPLYSAKFIEMVREQEAMIREAVFGHQIQLRDDAGHVETESRS